MREFISKCIVVDINEIINERVVELRKKYELKLPDSIIMASSTFLNIPILTADSDFKKVKEIDLLYYQQN